MNFGRLGQNRISGNKQTLRMRVNVSQSSTKAYWTRVAIAEYCSLKMRPEVSKLRGELRKLEELSIDDLVEFEIPLDLSEERRIVNEYFENLEIHEMLYRLATIRKQPEKTGLHVNCLKRKDQFFFSSLAGKGFSDAQGKVVANSPSAPQGVAPPSEVWFDHESLVEMSFHYHVSSEGFIRSACQTMSRLQQIDERQPHPNLNPKSICSFWTRVCVRYRLRQDDSGDMVSAAHLLIPQLENSLRFALSNNGFNTAKLNLDLTQEEQSLSQLYSNQRKELKRIFGVDITYGLHLLFNLKGGPMLRHEMANGKLSAGDCYHPSCVYACW